VSRVISEHAGPGIHVLLTERRPDTSSRSFLAGIQPPDVFVDFMSFRGCRGEEFSIYFIPDSEADQRFLAGSHYIYSLSLLAAKQQQMSLRGQNS
jgi:hypothetical protein